MANPQDLFSRALMAGLDATELGELMADMSTLSRTHTHLVSNVANELLDKSIYGYLVLSEYQAAMCNVHIAHGYFACGYSVRDGFKSMVQIRQVAIRLERLREASKPSTTALGMEEHRQARVTLLVVRFVNRSAAFRMAWGIVTILLWTTSWFSHPVLVTDRM
jgi:hypothetical protein